jgi:hypothetical protein
VVSPDWRPVGTRDAIHITVLEDGLAPSKLVGGQKGSVADEGQQLAGVDRLGDCVERLHCTSLPRDLGVGNPVVRIAEHLLIASERSGPRTGKAAIDIQIGARHRLDREPPLEHATYD